MYYLALGISRTCSRKYLPGSIKDTYFPSVLYSVLHRFIKSQSCIISKWVWAWFSYPHPCWLSYTLQPKDHWGSLSVLSCLLLRTRISLLLILGKLLRTTLMVKLATNIRRAFSSTARALLEVIWAGTKSHPTYEESLKKKMSKNRKLSGADKVKFASVAWLQCLNNIFDWHDRSGDPHTSDKDKELRASGQIFQGDTRLTSVHVYANGTVEYSKASFNKAQE